MGSHQRRERATLRIQLPSKLPYPVSFLFDKRALTVQRPFR
jgi:uncharacterized SAM-binding protein YcdF (DUF218 family)